jgi:hypothetical protein
VRKRARVRIGIIMIIICVKIENTDTMNSEGEKIDALSMNIYFLSGVMKKKVHE